MNNISQFRDAETLRQQRNMTTSQRKNNSNVKEGVVVNTFIKDCPECNVDLNDTYDSLIISDSIRLPKQLKEDKITTEKSLLPLSATALAVTGIITAATAFISRNAKISTKLAEEKWVPTLTRNISINDETAQAIFQMVTNPNHKTIKAGAGVLTLTAMAFMGKTFFDGFKEVWVKKKEADIQKNLQEKLINIETQSFAGKIQITRNMLSEKAKELSNYLSQEKILPNFGKDFNFRGNQDKKENTKLNNGVSYFLLGASTVASILGLTYISLKNLNKTKTFLKEYVGNNKTTIEKIIKTTNDSTKNIDKNNLGYLFQSIDADEKYIRDVLKNVNWENTEKEDFIKNIIKKIKTSTVKVNPHIGGDGTPKPSFSSFVDDYRAYFYNWILDTDNKQFQQLFWGMTGAAAVSYGGKLTGDAIKEVQVKKFNAQTEIELQQRLVSTELRNFKSKKDAAIEPLIQEFHKQVQNGKPKEELKVMADNILLEIKNGPPFVYS